MLTEVPKNKGVRKTYKELQNIMEFEGVSRIWSWSKFNCIHNSRYEYYLKYIKRIEPDRQDSIYVSTGSIAHDILEKYYTGALKYEDMIDEFNDGWTTAFDISGLKFDRSDEERNKKIAEKYYADLFHFFKKHTPLKGIPMVEQFVKAKIGDNLFHGYIDICFKDEEGNYHIKDWKTSSIYKGAKAENECGQLVVYAIGLMQNGIPMDKIKIGWDFLKYVTVQYEQANGSEKTREIERYEIGEKLQSNAKVWLKKLGYTDDIEYYLDLLSTTNDIGVLPQDVQDKYVITDCVVEVPLTQELIDKWSNDIITTIKDIEFREQEYEKNPDDDTIFWDTDEHMKSQSYYFANLCGYSANLHLPYKKYLEEFEANRENVNIFGGVNSGEENIPSTSKNSVDANDLSWLDEI